MLDGEVLYNEKVMNSMNSTETKRPNFNLERGKKYEMSWHNKTWIIILVEKSSPKESFDLVLSQDTVMIRGIVVSRSKDTSNYIMQDTALCIKSLQLKVDSINGQDTLSIKCNAGLIYSEPCIGKINGLNLLLSSTNYYEFIYRNHKWSIGKERSSHEMGIGMALLLLLIGVLLGLLTIFCIKLVKKWNKNSPKRTLNKLLSATSKEPIELYFYIVNNYENAKLDLQKAKVLGNCDFADKVAVINRAKQILNLDDLQILLCLEPFKECVNAEDVFLIIKENLNDDSLKKCIVQSGIFTDEVPKTQDDYLNQIANVLKIDNEVVASKEILGLLGKNTLEESVLAISDYKKISDIVNEKIDTNENTSVEDIDNALGKLVEYRSFYDQILKHEIFKNKESISYDNVRYYLDRYIQLTDSYTKIANKINQYYNSEIEENEILSHFNLICSEASFSIKDMLQSFADKSDSFVTKIMEKIDSNIINANNTKLFASLLDVLNGINIGEFWKLYKNECEVYVVHEILTRNAVIRNMIGESIDPQKDLNALLLFISQKLKEQERIVEVVKEVPKEVEVVKEVEVIKQVEIPKIVEVIKEVEVVKEVEVIKEVEKKVGLTNDEFIQAINEHIDDEHSQIPSSSADNLAVYIADSIVQKHQLSLGFEQLQSNYDLVKTRNKELSKKEKKTAKELEEKREENQLLLKDKESLQRVNDGLQADKTQLEDDNRLLDTENSKLNRRNRELQNELDMAAQEIERKDEELRKKKEILHNANSVNIQRAIKLVEQLRIKVQTQFLVANSENADDICQSRMEDTRKKVIKLHDSILSIKGKDDDNPLDVYMLIKNILQLELDKRFNAFENIARNYAYSQLSFMTDSANSVSYDRTIMLDIYKTAEALLSAFGITLLLPSLFSIKDTDGVYNKTTATSDLNNICPTARNHKYNIDASDKDDIIIDIARLGYLIDGKIINPTEVIV